MSNVHIFAQWQLGQQPSTLGTQTPGGFIFFLRERSLYSSLLHLLLWESKASCCRASRWVTAVLAWHWAGAEGEPMCQRRRQKDCRRRKEEMCLLKYFSALHFTVAHWGQSHNIQRCATWNIHDSYDLFWKNVVLAKIQDMKLQLWSNAGWRQTKSLTQWPECPEI